MIVEVVIQNKNENFKTPVMFIKKPSKTIIKRFQYNNENLILDKIVARCIEVAKYSEHVFLKLDMNIGYKNEAIIKSLKNVSLVNTASEEMETFIWQVNNEFKVKTPDYVNLGFFSYGGVDFISAYVKNEHRLYQKVFFRKANEKNERFINRSLNASFKNKKLDGVIINVSKSEFFESFIEKNKSRYNFNLWAFDDKDFIMKNKSLIESKVRSEKNNNKLKSKYQIDEKEKDKYTNPILIYTDGAVFPDGRSGIGVVVVENNHVIEFFGKAVDFNIDSNECESIAIYEALKYVQTKLPFSVDYVEIRTDSLNCLKDMDEEKDVGRILEVNDLLKTVSSFVDINMRWNKGHVGIFHNEMADMMAKKVCEVV